MTFLMRDNSFIIYKSMPGQRYMQMGSRWDCLQSNLYSYFRVKKILHKCELPAFKLPAIHNSFFFFLSFPKYTVFPKYKPMH